VTGEILARAWAAGAGPGDGPLVVDVDSTICEVHGYHKQGACYGYTHRLGYHPLLAARANSGELKGGAGLAHLPSGRFAANAAWLLAATLAHNLLRWTASLGLAPRRATGRQDAAPHAGCATRPAHPLRPAMEVAPACRLAVGPLSTMALARLRCMPYPT
jgi:hypothetical protein